ncbi:hypothetical protein QVD17_19383 [Tagetes erecta]|uniref:RING-type E3 ubiquitin transferase n=1 Tax=Tagetes erecta TaxID=13708 RepID=A0AAD8KMJ2_TARER|nr:hypothetical protein QVD17_19383 [Tagetes erecta]
MIVFIYLDIIPDICFTSNLLSKMRQQNMVYPEPSINPYGHGPLSSGIMFLTAPPMPRVVPFGPPHTQLLLPGHQLIDGPHNVFKGKTIEGLHINPHYSYPTPGSSHFVVPEYIGSFNVIPVVVAQEHHRGTNHQIISPIDLNHGLQLMPMSLGGLGQHVQFVPGPWLDQQFYANVPRLPYMQGYTNENQITFVHQPIVPPMPPLQPMLRFVRPMPPTTSRVYQPHGQELMIQANSNTRYHGLPHLRAHPEAEVAMLSFGNYGHRVDHHRDMRLDIDHMSYEELLALGEQIGNVGSGLSEDFILGRLKTRIFTFSNLEDVSTVDQSVYICTICQMEYNDQEQIGMLDCSHEYHVECIEKWLVEKNSCPVCKCTGLATQGKKS